VLTAIPQLPESHLIVLVVIHCWRRALGLLSADKSGISTSKETTDVWNPELVLLHSDRGWTGSEHTWSVNAFTTVHSEEGKCSRLVQGPQVVSVTVTCSGILQVRHWISALRSPVATMLLLLLSCWAYCGGEFRRWWTGNNRIQGFLYWQLQTSSKR
jgi:hypothetical protein